MEECFVRNVTTGMSCFSVNSAAFEHYVLVREACSWE